MFSGEFSPCAHLSSSMLHMCERVSAKFRMNYGLSTNGSTGFSDTHMHFTSIAFKQEIYLPFRRDN